MHSNASMLAISRYKTGLELGFGIKNYFEPLLIKSNLNLALNKLYDYCNLLSNIYLIDINSYIEKNST